MRDICTTGVSQCILGKNGARASTLTPFCRGSIVLLSSAMSATITLVTLMTSIRGKKFNQQAKKIILSAATLSSVVVAVMMFFMMMAVMPSARVIVEGALVTLLVKSLFLLVDFCLFGSQDL